jgi:chaperonin GroEL (HSP60 family)
MQAGFCTFFLKKVLGSCEVFEEKQVGNERFNIFSGCPYGQTATIVLRGGADQVFYLYTSHYLFLTN